MDPGIPQAMVEDDGGTRHLAKSNTTVLLDQRIQKISQSAQHGGLTRIQRIMVARIVPAILLAQGAAGEINK